MKLSVIVTVHNRLAYLEKCLISLENQSYKPDEIIICDDGSAEDVLSLLKSFAKNTNISYKYVRQSFQGFRVARSRNNGVLHSVGDILVFLDSDIILTQKYLEKIFVFFSKNFGFFISNYPIRLTEKQTNTLTLDDISNYNFKIISFKQKFKILRQFLKDNFYTFTNKFRKKTKRHSPKLRGGVCAILRQDFFEVNGYDERFIGWGNEDDNLSKRLYIKGLNGKNIALKDSPIHLYHTPFHNNGERRNSDLSRQLKKEANLGIYATKYGLSNRYQNDEVIGQYLS